MHHAEFSCLTNIKGGNKASFVVYRSYELENVSYKISYIISAKWKIYSVDVNF